MKHKVHRLDVKSDNMQEKLEIFLNWLRELQGIREPILEDFIPEDAGDILQDFTIGGIEFSEEEYQAIIDATRNLAEEIEKIEEVS